MGSDESADARAVLRTVWSADEVSVDDLPDSEGKICRNMVGVSFEGMVADGTDLRTAWRAKLASEGKLAHGSVHDLIFERGDAADARATARAVSERHAD